MLNHCLEWCICER